VRKGNRNCAEFSIRQFGYRLGGLVLQCLKTCSCTIQLHRILHNHMSLQNCNASSLYVHTCNCSTSMPAVYFILFSHGKKEVNVNKAQSIILSVELQTLEECLFTHSYW
jgi:hypothetical protein